MSATLFINKCPFGFFTVNKKYPGEKRFGLLLVFVYFDADERFVERSVTRTGEKSPFPPVSLKLNFTRSLDNLDEEPIKNPKSSPKSSH